MLAERPSRRRAAQGVLPAWFFPALAAWMAVAAGALANATAIPVRADIVAALIAAAAVAHGLLWRRWRVAAPVAAVALGLSVGLALGDVSGLVLSDAGGAVHRSGPADSVAVRLIWMAAALIGALVIAWGVRLHVRLQAHFAQSRSRPLGWEESSAIDGGIRQQVDEVERRLGVIEKLLSAVPGPGSGIGEAGLPPGRGQV